MDPISIAPLVISTWNLIAPYAKKVGEKLAEKASDALPDAVGKVWDTVKGKMEERPETKTLPTDLAATPDDQSVQGAFQYQLKKLLENDDAFAQQLENLVNDAKEGSVSNIGDGAVATNHSNAIGKIEAGHDISGNIMVGNKNSVNSSKPARKKN
jgi:hypothetical protein